MFMARMNTVCYAWYVLFPEQLHAVVFLQAIFLSAHLDVKDVFFLIRLALFFIQHRQKQYFGARLGRLALYFSGLARNFLAGFALHALSFLSFGFYVRNVLMNLNIVGSNLLPDSPGGLR